MTELMLQWGELIGMFIAFVLTLAVMSYLIGDNALFRFATHLFIGATAGYVTVLILYDIVWRQLVVPLWRAMTSPQGSLNIAIPIGLILGLVLLAARGAAWGRPVVALLAAVGVATAIGGALFGTLLPQVSASSNMFAPGVAFSAQIMGIFVVIGTVSTLVYFNFRARTQDGLAVQQPIWLRAIRWLGQFFVAVTFAVLFAAVFTASLTAFVQRLAFLWDFVVEHIFNLFPLS